jgi:hypothetical protein
VLGKDRSGALQHPLAIATRIGAERAFRDHGHNSNVGLDKRNFNSVSC